MHVLAAVDSVGRISLDAVTVQIIVSMLIPLVVGLLTKWDAPAKVKSTLMLVIQAASALVISATVADGTAVLSQPTLVQFAIGLVVSIASHLGIYKPVGIAANPSTGQRGILAPDAGVGGPAAP